MSDNWVQCRKCRAQQVKSLPAGYVRVKRVHNGIEQTIVVECDCHIKWRLAMEMNAKLKASGFTDVELLSDEFAYQGSSDNITRLKKYADSFSLRNKTGQLVRETIIYISGTTGTQKTATVYWLAREILRCYDVQYVTYDNLLNTYISSLWNDELTSITQRWENCDLLIIDECFQSIKTDKQIMAYEKLIEIRLANKKGIIFVSRIDLDSLTPTQMSSSLKDRIKKETTRRSSKMRFTDQAHDVPEVLF